MSRATRLVLAGALALAALVTGGVALAANPAPAAPATAVERGGPAGLHPVQVPAQVQPDPDCPSEGGTTGAAAAVEV